MQEIATFTIADVFIGQSFSFETIISAAMIDEFARLTGDISSLHQDRNFAIQRGFKDRVAHGALLSGLASRLVGVHLPGKNCLLHGMNLKYLAPTYPDDLIRVTGTIDQVSIAAKAMIIAIELLNVHLQIIVAKGKVTIGFTEDR